MKKTFSISLSITVITILIFIINCKKKEETFIIKGIVTENATGVPLSNCNLSLSSNSISNGVYNAGFSSLGTTITNANGEYSFEIPIQKTVTFKLSIIKTNYFSENIEFDLDNLGSDKTFTNNFKLDPEATITFVAKNLYPYDENDKICYNYKGLVKNVPDGCSDQLFCFDGMGIFDSTTCKTVGNSSVIIEYLRYRNGNFVQFKDTIFCPAFQNTRFPMYL